MDTNQNLTTVILDVDGVINGTLEGINTPMPSKPVMARLQNLAEKEIRVILCTSKGLFPILDMIKLGGFDNYHIVDGGAIIINPFNKEQIIKAIDTQYANEIIADLVKKQIYFEVYTVNDYFVPEYSPAKYIDPHAKLMGKMPIKTEDFDKIIRENEISKIMLMTDLETTDPQNKEIFTQYDDLLELKWTSTPSIPGANLLVFTQKGISKKTATEEVGNLLKIDFDDALGVGDNLSDWTFMHLCGYVAAMGNATQELKDMLTTKEKGHYVVGNDVDKDGILDILDHFNLFNSHYVNIIYSYS